MDQLSLIAWVEGVEPMAVRAQHQWRCWYPGGGSTLELAEPRLRERNKSINVSTSR